MNKLDIYSKMTKDRQEYYNSCVRAIGPFQLGPTNKGGLYLRYGDKEISNDLSINDLKSIKLLIEDFLENVVGEFQ